METIFWFSFAFVFYVYLGYPALLVLWRGVVARPVKKRYWEPTVTIVIAAHNEREKLERKLENCLALDYPHRKRQIIVSLDGSADGSEFLVWKYVQRGVELIHCRNHAGKASALNRALKRATGEIIVFADVRQTFDGNAIRELVANFADGSVGAVSGELILTPSDSGRGLETGDACEEATTDVGLYWRYEKALRSMESEIHSITGATGAIYAIRRELYEELPEDTILDDVLTPLRIVLQGKRAVFEPQAKAYDAVACCSRAEYGRKVRTLCGNYQLLVRCPLLLLPWRNPIFVQFLSHKVGRLLVPWALAALLITNLTLLGGVYVVTLALQAAWYAFAIGGYALSRRDTASIVISDSERAA